MEDLLIADQMELLYNDSDIPTYLHYNGNGTNPDLTLASADIADDVEREVIYDPGLRPPHDYYWDWFLTQVIIQRDPLEIDGILPRPTGRTLLWKTRLFSRIRFEFLGKQFNYKPFWNENLAALKEKSSTARFIAKQSKNPEDVQNWRKSVALLRKEILTAKRHGKNYHSTRLVPETNNLLTFPQAGFRKCQSTNQQVVFLGQSIKDALNQRYSALALFVDFEAAFDKIWRLKCIQNCRPWVCAIICLCDKNFISQRFSAVRFEMLFQF
ncbi:putative RNA-directed DNA polymerase from transposon X-element [Trichonephila clavipes]|nr:putative RNA-directed DNA polymerase from transposon X-element [Trichonephila clavipes]